MWAGGTSAFGENPLANARAELFWGLQHSLICKRVGLSLCAIARVMAVHHVYRVTPRTGRKMKALCPSVSHPLSLFSELLFIPAAAAVPRHLHPITIPPSPVSLLQGECQHVEWRRACLPLH